MGFIAGTATRSTGGTVPPGGNVGSVLVKRSLNNFDMAWDDVLPQTIADLLVLTSDLGLSKVSRSGDQMTGDLRWPGSSGIGALVNSSQVRVDDGTDASVVTSTAIYANMLQTPSGLGGLAFGVNFAEGGIYKSQGGGIIIRQSSDDSRVRIELNSGSTGWAIIDERGGTLVGPLSMGNNYIADLLDPSSSQDAATKAYVDATGAANRVLKTGDTMTGALTVVSIVTADGFNCPVDNSGYGFYSGGLLYKKGGAGLVVRLSSGNQELQIENNNGTGARNVLTNLTGVQKTGDSMTGNLNFPNVGQGLTGAGGCPLFSTTSGNLGINAGTLTVNANEVVTGTLQCNNTLWMNNAGIQLRAVNNNNNVYTQSLSFARADGGWWAWMRAYQNGYYISPQGIFELWTNNGGWGSQRVMWTDTGAPSNTYFGGDVYSRGVKLMSDSDLKDEITPVDPVTSAEAFDVLNPVRFKWKPPEVDDPLAAGGKRTMPLKDPDRYYWGFVADDIKDFVPDAVYEDEDGMLSYDPVSILAVTVSQLQTLKQEVAELKSRRR